MYLFIINTSHNPTQEQSSNTSFFTFLFTHIAMETKTMIDTTRIISDPPLLDRYRELLPTAMERKGDQHTGVIGECQLPLIDLSVLMMNHNAAEKQACAAAIARASSEWGFFQVVNHGISSKLLEEMKREQIKVFEMPFEKKASSGFLNDSYRWGNATATAPQHFSWSEAFHVPLNKISNNSSFEDLNSLREVMEKVTAAMSKLAQLLAGVLAENLGHPRMAFDEICNKNTCFLRLNRYPKCEISSEMAGLVPHTDTDFLTILYQDEVGGLQLKKDSSWFSVKPNKEALVVNIGDMFQVWSNDEYKSVEHKVIANGKTERYSMAYLLCPSYDYLIGSCKKPSPYRDFTFGDYKKQVQEDVKKTGEKVGLSRFLLH